MFAPPFDLLARSPFAAINSAKSVQPFTATALKGAGAKRFQAAWRSGFTLGGFLRLTVHTSCCACKLIHSSASVSNAAARRTAISGVTGARAFTMAAEVAYNQSVT
jgi:hypothetical protein